MFFAVGLYPVRISCSFTLLGSEVYVFIENDLGQLASAVGLFEAVLYEEYSCRRGIFSLARSSPSVFIGRCLEKTTYVGKHREAAAGINYICLFGVFTVHDCKVE